jgi:ATP-dependent helicase Lhr and Lhr-like helicase
VVFPDQLACAENLVGEREVPDHPLVAQTLHDCLHEAMDVDGLERLLARIEAGEVRGRLPRPRGAVAAGAARSSTRGPTRSSTTAPAEERRTLTVAEAEATPGLRCRAGDSSAG